MSERKGVLLRLDPAVHDALARWANDELRSTNAQIEFLLRRALADAGRLPRHAGPMRPRGRPPAGDPAEPDQPKPARRPAVKPTYHRKPYGLRMGRIPPARGQRGVHGGLNAGTPEHRAIRPAGGDLRRADVADDFRPSHRHPRPGRVPGLHARDAVRGAGREQVLRLLPDLGRGDGGPDQPGRQRGAAGARHHAHLRLAVRHARREPSPPEAGAAAGIHGAADGDRPAQPHHQGGVRLPAAAVLPARVPGLPVSRDRAPARPARQAGGLDQRGGRDEYPRPPARGKSRPARRPGHAGRERRQERSRCSA